MRKLFTRGFCEPLVLSALIAALFTAVALTTKNSEATLLSYAALFSYVFAGSLYGLSRGFYWGQFYEPTTVPLHIYQNPKR